ncbi:mucin-6-like isoform X2 [Halichondria panicea]|uniref:mucin-6-like isoform X2 n=1 Tax=Halichondria panicea TaxID=6063 RepID=UPI00312BC240
METSAASVSRTGSFRKRALEERESLDMDVDLLPSKHERAPSENEMDVSANSNTVQDEIEAHFQRSLAQAKSGAPPLTPSHTHTTHSQSSHSHQPTEKHARVTTSPTGSTPTHEHESHRIVVALNNHATSPLDHSSRQSPTTTLANGLQTNLPVPVRPVSKTSSTSVSTPRNLQRFSPPSGGSPVSTSVHTLPMLTIPSGGIVNSDSGGTILSPALTPQLVQQFMAQQSLSFLQEQQKQHRQNHVHQQQGYTKINPNLITQIPNLVSLNQNISSKGLQIIDLTKNQLASLPTQAQRSIQGQCLPKPHPNVVYVSKDGTQVTPLVTMGTGNIGGALRVLNPSGAQLNPQTKAINKASSTLVTATTTQPTPAVTSTLLSNSQLVGGQGFPPMMVPMMDPNTSQMMTGVTSGNQIVFLSAPPVVQQQPVVLINPNDLSALQQLQTGGVQPGINLLSSGFTFPSTSGGPGYIILSPGQKSPSFAPPLINMAQTTGASPIITMAMQNSSPPPLTATPPLLTKTNRASRTKIPPLDPPQRRTSLDSISPGAEDNDDVMMTPASVEDHFAKALGDQWSKLQTGNDFNGHPRSIQTAQT